MRARRTSIGFLLVVLALAVTSAALPTSAQDGVGNKDERDSQGIFKLEHLIFIVQENRSFDHYFGTFPDANGFPRNAAGKIDVCIPNPYLGHCSTPYHTHEPIQLGGRHNDVHSDIDIAGGKMNGFVRSLPNVPGRCWKQPKLPGCSRYVGPKLQPDVMSYMNHREIPNYWKLAKNFVLADRMFAPSDSWTLPAHLYLVSGWSARCTEPNNPMSCTSDAELKGPEFQYRYGEDPVYAWTDITDLLDEQHVSWAYYVDDQTCMDPPCGRPDTNQSGPVKNPLPGFTSVHENHSLGRIQFQRAYLKSAEAGTLPSVSWIVPGHHNSEHPKNGGAIKTGMAFVTRMVNAAMKSPNWDSTAIFVTWDDWGGFYDHVRPAFVDEPGGYGIRVPMITMSPYAKSGYIDSQILSFDAFLKLIEDRFLGSARLDPATMSRPDSRLLVRENVGILGDLAKEFDFNQPPRPPFVLDPTPFGH
ncbi:MAG: alkaline phosphatase family protein [Actinomycetota bacterium]